MDARIFYKLFTGTITVNSERLKYALTIDYVAPESFERRSFDAYDAKFSAANSDGDIVDVFTRHIDSRSGPRTPEGIRREMLRECQENFD